MTGRTPVSKSPLFVLRADEVSRKKQKSGINDRSEERNIGDLGGSFSAVSKPIFASKY